VALQRQRWPDYVGHAIVISQCELASLAFDKFDFGLVRVGSYDLNIEWNAILKNPEGANACPICKDSCFGFSGLPYVRYLDTNRKNFTRCQLHFQDLRSRFIASAKKNHLGVDALFGSFADEVLGGNVNANFTRTTIPEVERPAGCIAGRIDTEN
jgi:hypothetical protein